MLIKLKLNKKTKIYQPFTVVYEKNYRKVFLFYFILVIFLILSFNIVLIRSLIVCLNLYSMRFCNFEKTL